jgi:hypothetical protein
VCCVVTAAAPLAANPDGIDRVACGVSRAVTPAGVVATRYTKTPRIGKRRMKTPR